MLIQMITAFMVGDGPC